MWWELLRYPAGDAQAQVFWRRRISVLAVVGVLLLLLLVLLFRGNGSPDSVTPTAAERPASAASVTSALPPSPGAAPSGTPTATPSVTATPSGAPGAAGSARVPSATNSATTCAAGTMALRLASDAPTYAAGAQPVLTLSFVDVGSQPCVVDLGTTSTSLSILSGGKPVWTSTACAPKVMRPTSLTPAAAQVLQLRWDRTDNASGCTSPSAAPAGQYEIVAKVGSAAVYGGSLVLS